jgi:transcriptional regulator with XRE-family HTH domain
MKTPEQALREARLAAGLQQKDVAAALGISPSYLTDIELGRRQFPPERLASLPEPIKHAVAEALIAERQGEIDKIQEATREGAAR